MVKKSTKQPKKGKAAVKKDSGQMKLDLLENGLDFIETAIQNLSRGNNKDLKYGILHLSAGVDLVLKYRLSQEHWSLLFADTDKASKEKLNSGDFSTVDSKKCLDRLTKICGIQFSDEDLNQLRHLRERRNRLEHFGISDSSQALKVSTIKVLNFILNFINQHMDYRSLNRSEKSHMDAIRESLRDFEDFVAKRLIIIKPEIEKHKKFTAVTFCPTCYQPALVIDSGAKCLFCGASGEGEEIAGEFVSNILGISQYITVEGGEYPLYDCSECGHESLVRTDNGEELPGWICFTCGTQWSEDEKVFCETCGQPYTKEEHDLGMCSDCISYRVNQ